MNDRNIKAAGNLFVLGWFLGTGGILCGVVLFASPSWFFLTLFLALVTAGSVTSVTAIMLVAAELGGFRALVDRVLRHAAFRDPTKKRINGRSVCESDSETEQMLHSLEELQEASR